MRQHRQAAGTVDPVDCLSKVRPGGRHIADPAGAKIAAECITRIAYVLLFHQEAGEMAASDRGRISGMARGARQAAGYAGGIELGCDPYRTLAARAADRGQPVRQFRRMRIDVQTDYMDGLPVPAGRDLDTGNQPDIETGGGLHRLDETAGFVVISQCEQAYASRCCPADQFRRRKHSIGIRGVGV